MESRAGDVRREKRQELKLEDQVQYHRSSWTGHFPEGWNYESRVGGPIRALTQGVKVDTNLGTAS